MQSRTLALIASIVLTVLVAGSGAPAGAQTQPRPLINVQVPLDQTVRDLLRGSLVENVTCAQSCRTTTTIFIRAQLARSLGFKNVKGQQVAVGSRRMSLAARTRVKIRLPVSAAAETLLAGANPGTQLIGRVVAQAVPTGSRRGTANWITSLGR
jgi:hypothetical protein